MVTGSELGSESPRAGVILSRCGSFAETFSQPVPILLPAATYGVMHSAEVLRYFPTMGKRAMATEVSYLSVDQKGRATLPEEVRASLGLRPGDFVLLEKTERGTYELVPAALVPRDQLWFHHPEKLVAHS
jgi:AbrB family looped-hinge helix DNA binding protein